MHVSYKFLHEGFLQNQDPLQYAQESTSTLLYCIQSSQGETLWLYNSLKRKEGDKLPVEAKKKKKKSQMSKIIFSGIKKKNPPKLEDVQLHSR